MTRHELIADAVRTDHPCDSNSCDIAMALSEGFLFSAADLLMGASTTPAVDGVRASDVAGFEESVASEHPAWSAWYLDNTFECPSCATRVRRGYDCENCGEAASDVA